MRSAHALKPSTRQELKRDRSGRAWHGAMPKDDDDARERIIQAAKRCIARDGVTGANIAAVAAEVGVTRRTIYRLFESSEHLIQTIAEQSTGVTLNKMIAHVNSFKTFEERLVEAIMYLSKVIPKDPMLGNYFSIKNSKRSRVHEAFSEQSLDFSLQMLKMIYPGSSKNLDEKLLRQLAEHMQRLVLGFILAPGASLASDKSAREYLQRWFVPAVERTLGLEK